MKKTVTINQFVEDLIKRIDEHKGIDCCREDIKAFARHVSGRIGHENIEVEWKEPPK